MNCWMVTGVSESIVAISPQPRRDDGMQVNPCCDYIYDYMIKDYKKPVNVHASDFFGPLPGKRKPPAIADREHGVNA